MPSILDDLFRWTEPEFTSEDYRQALKKILGHHDIIGKRLGSQFLNELCTLESGISSVSSREAFIRGVRLGFQLFSALRLSKYSS